MRIVRSVCNSSVNRQSHQQIVQTFVKIFISVIFDDCPDGFSDCHVSGHLVVHELPEDVGRVDSHCCGDAGSDADSYVVEVGAFEMFLEEFSHIVVYGLYGENAGHHYDVAFPKTRKSFVFEDGSGAVRDGFVGLGDASEVVEFDVALHAHFEDFCGGGDGDHTAEGGGFGKYRIEHSY